MSWCGYDHCITCSDEGIPMRVVKLDPARGVALCESADGERATVETALLEAVAPGDELLVHAGVALLRLEPAA
ncbi:MAG TPA: HypC/HybG/HupF family hydrogenase formation chaperone [Thermoleophilaceae bacterium]|nr:HypC/HybG/HupF family hydrogenase formation chaperone [Thermoleophilaceae bacterium]